LLNVLFNNSFFVFLLFSTLGYWKICYIWY